MRRFLGWSAESKDGKTTLTFRREYHDDKGNIVKTDILRPDEVSPAIVAKAWMRGLVGVRRDTTVQAPRGKRRNAIRMADFRKTATELRAAGVESMPHIRKEDTE